MLSVTMLSVTVLSVTMLSVVMLNVVAPYNCTNLCLLFVLKTFRH
jgi:hypothetical protein